MLLSLSQCCLALHGHPLYLFDWPLKALSPPKGDPQWLGLEKMKVKSHEDLGRGSYSLGTAALPLCLVVFVCPTRCWFLLNCSKRSDPAPNKTERNVSVMDELTEKMSTILVSITMRRCTSKKLYTKISKEIYERESSQS